VEILVDLLRERVGSTVSLSSLARELQTSVLCFLRDKEKREVDFLAVVDGKPRLLVEAKLADDAFSRALGHFLGFMPGSTRRPLSSTK